MKRTTFMATSIFCGLLTFVFLALPALARDRPGTPNGGFAGNCSSYLTEEPAVCVSFRNTATEKVGFLMEWTENGVLMASDLSGRAECLSQSAQAYYCSALQFWFGGHTDFEPADHLGQLMEPTGAPKFTTDHEYPEGFRLKRVLYDSDYCFRFIAVTMYGVRSGAWSGFTCVHTPPPPEKPAAPDRPKVTGIQPTSGTGVIGAATPFKLLVEWSGPQVGGASVGWYSIELWQDSRWIAVPSLSDPNKANFATQFEALVTEHLAPPDQRQAVRVCSQNIQQKSCSDGSWYNGLIVPKDKATARPEIARVSPVLPTAVAVDRPMAKLAAAPAPVPAPPDLDALAARGAEAVANDPLANELRNRTPEGPMRRGFDAGFAIWIASTAPGPGKQRVHDALSQAEQPGYDIAASFSLPHNKYASLAGVGAAIANADPQVAEARNAEDDVFFWLGFDIASGLFGDPRAGSQGSTALGPGGIAIRDSLNAPAQRGFDASMTLHLGRTYP